MKLKRFAFRFAAALVLLLLAAFAIKFTWRVGEINGVVVSDGKPLAGATVRLKAVYFSTVTDVDGRFVLNGFPPDFNVHVTAWRDGYYVGGKVIFPWQRGIAISLEPYQTDDNKDYEWTPPKVSRRSVWQGIQANIGLPVAAKLSFDRLFLPLAAKLQLGCADCHGSIIYREYTSSAHSKGADNVIFRTVYHGTDAPGSQSPLTRYGFSRDYGQFPLPPAQNEPYYGPGFKLDFPDQAGNCANCHEPGQAVNVPNSTDIDKIPAGAVRGTHCDFCHKIAGVKLDPSTQLPSENMPGVLSLEMRRPSGEPQLFFGPFDDVDVGPDTYLPLQNESRICAACHNASFWGTPIYQSYAEWLKSPYPSEGKTCQSCHMKPDGITTNFAPGRGGVSRDSQRIFSHKFQGAADAALLQNTARLQLSAEIKDGRIKVNALVTNENAGHDIPTDQPMRNIILLVEAKDGSGNSLKLLSGPVVPDWGGLGDGVNDYAGRPGKGFAKILQEVWTETTPSIAYWRQTRIITDNRIPARASDLSTYEFQQPAGGFVKITARLIFRRAFKEMAEQKKWNVSDIQMKEAKLTIP